MDQKLENYLKELRQRHKGLSFPSFSTRHSDHVEAKRILAIYQDPGNSGPEQTDECCVAINTDPTAKRQRGVIDDLGIDKDNILFWNFFPFFGLENDKIRIDHALRKRWAGELGELVKLLPNLCVIVVAGKKARQGMQFFEPVVGVPLIWTPLPSGRGLMKKGSKELHKEQWRRAKILADL